VKENIPIVLFTIDGNLYALHLDAIERVIHAIFITPIPKAPDIVAGVINIEGTVIPVIDLRKRFNLILKTLHPDQQFIIANSATRKIALIVDSVGEVIECNLEDIASEKTVLPDMPYVKGIIATEQGVILINDIDKFLSLEDEKIIDDALKAQKLM
jgi:purine-binding chemotaxis protein CheW